MTVRITFSCDGCHTETGPHPLPHRKFRSFNGSGWGFGVWDNPTIEDATPEGWLHSDPITGCTYCPDCWAEIMDEAPPQALRDAGER